MPCGATWKHWRHKTRKEKLIFSFDAVMDMHSCFECPWKGNITCVTVFQCSIHSFVSRVYYRPNYVLYRRYSLLTQLLLHTTCILAGSLSKVSRKPCVRSFYCCPTKQVSLYANRYEVLRELRRWVVVLFIFSSTCNHFCGRTLT